MLKTLGKSGKVCHKWCQSFIKRHKFAPRKARHVDPSRAAAGGSSDTIIEYHQLIKREIDSLQLNDHPECIWNADEKGWSKQQALQQPVLVTVGKQQVREMATFLCGCTCAV